MLPPRSAPLTNSLNVHPLFLDVVFVWVTVKLEFCAENDVEKAKTGIGYRSITQIQRASAAIIAIGQTGRSRRVPMPTREGIKQKVAF